MKDGNIRNFLFFIILILAGFGIPGIFAQTGRPVDPIGIIAFAQPTDNQFVGSPSIIVLPNGTYIASHDIFGQGANQQQSKCRIYRSEDKGRSWTMLTELTGQAWSTLFRLGNSIYLLGTSGFENGNLVIRRSDDMGQTWTEPKSGDMGLLAVSQGKGFHTAPVPVVIHKGRVWRAIEVMDAPGDWPEFFRSQVISAPVGADLLKTQSWTFSNKLAFQPNFFPFSTQQLPGWLEGNIVITPEGKIVNILRTFSIPRFDYAAMIDVSDDGTTIKFNPDKGMIKFPGGLCKFTIRWDDTSKKYWSIVNLITNDSPSDNSWDNSVYHQRNVLALTSSPDLKNWTVNFKILRYSEGRALNKDNKVGFQYVDFQFDGNDIVAVCRTAMNNAANYHDAKYLTFHRIRNFRTLLLKDSPPDITIVKQPNMWD